MDYSQLDSIIDSFHRDCLHISISSRADKDRLRELWQQVKEINEAFKSVRYPTKSDRDYAWQRFQEAVESLKRAQEESREHARDFARKSDARRDEILRVLEKAKMPGLLESLMSFLISPSQQEMWGRLFSSHLLTLR